MEDYIRSAGKGVAHYYKLLGFPTRDSDVVKFCRISNLHDTSSSSVDKTDGYNLYQSVSVGTVFITYAVCGVRVARVAVPGGLMQSGRCGEHRNLFTCRKSKSIVQPMDTTD